MCKTTATPIWPSADASGVPSLSPRDRRLLASLRARCRVLQRQMKRRCKHQRCSAPFAECEVLTLEALRNLEEAASFLLEIAGGDDTERRLC